MQISVKTSTSEREFFIKGDFTTKDEERFFDVFMQIRSMTEPCLVFNLSQCAFVDSAAMGMLVVACEEAAKRNIVRVLRKVPQSIATILISAGFEKYYYFQ